MHILRDFDVSARVWRLLMYVAWRLHSLVCHFFWFSLVCWGFVQGYLHRGCLCKRETRTEAELVERVEVAGALSIPVFGDILSGMFLVAGAVQPSVRSQERTPPLGTCTGVVYANAKHGRIWRSQYHYPKST